MSVPLRVDLSRDVAVVTGGSGILCGAMARALAECGAAVAVLGRNPEKLDRAIAAIRAAGGKAAAYACDVLDRAGMEVACARIEQELGPVTILINGAGGNHPKATAAKERPTIEELQAVPAAGTFFELDPAGVAAVFDLNFAGTLLATQVFAKGMAARGRGCVINISSMAAVRPLTKVVAYGAAKAAVNNFTQWLAVHLAKAGVRVNAVAPGFFLTEQNRALLTQPDGEPTPRGRSVVTHTPMGRFGQPAELLGAVLWLASSEAAGFVTGIVVPVDGGFSAYSGV
jgi:NAD(P)-dependent dehydrogenase (short-subunit alcohol dehydrogenase family)